MTVSASDRGGTRSSVAGRVPRLATGPAPGQGARAARSTRPASSPAAKGERRRIGPVAVRMVRPDDVEPVVRWLGELSGETAYRRFFAGGRMPDRLLRRLVDVDHETRDAAVLTVGKHVVALANVAYVAPGEIELAIVVGDAWQGQGFGPRVAAWITDVAAARGAHTLRASVQAGNVPAVRLIRRYWPDARPSIDGGVFEFRLPLRTAG